jgi:hypothetical protein
VPPNVQKPVTCGSFERGDSVESIKLEINDLHTLKAGLAFGHPCRPALDEPPVLI